MARKETDTSGFQVHTLAYGTILEAFLAEKALLSIDHVRDGLAGFTFELTRRPFPLACENMTMADCLTTHNLFPERVWR